MDYQHYCDAVQRVADQVDAGQHDDAIAGLQALLNSDLLEAAQPGQSGREEAGRVR
jgi:hypothetical protein